MKNKLTHFAIHTDNMEKARHFYEEVFGWGFDSYGPPDFLQIKTDTTAGAELIGALQSRSYSPVSERLAGLECTIGVEDVEALIKKVEARGGRVLMAKTAIPFVGWITKFLDPDGNLICAMEYNSNAR